VKLGTNGFLQAKIDSDFVRFDFCGSFEKGRLFREFARESFLLGLIFFCERLQANCFLCGGWERSVFV
jgi:hypothetical protein